MKKPTISGNKQTLSILQKTLETLDLQRFCILQEQESAQIEFNDRPYDKPVRIGKIIDDILHTTHQNAVKTIKLRGATLHPHLFRLEKKGTQAIITLTEKEVEILIFLHKQKPKAVTKEELLAAVWNYAQDVETHTLETHIYRLRQKIEDNPADPKILLTSSSGYTLS